MISKFGLLLMASALVYCNAQPPCVCTRDFKPVCGTDGETYPNECMLKCAKETSKSDVEVAKKGPCDKEPTCICTMEYNPVCANDGKTYSNPCEARCNKARVESYGNCDRLSIVEIPPCTCTKEKKPVCGTDGATYSNACMLNCATAVNSRLGIAHVGPCDEEVHKPENNGEGDCTCARNYTPVCGSDGVTYNNECLLKCSGKDKTKEGTCEDVNFVDN